MLTHNLAGCCILRVRSDVLAAAGAGRSGARPGLGPGGCCGRLPGAGVCIGVRDADREAASPGLLQALRAGAPRTGCSVSELVFCVVQLYLRDLPHSILGRG